MLNVFKYILNNPKKAGICPAKKYKWSSYNEFGKKGCISDSKIVAELVGSKKSLDEILEQEDLEEYMDAFTAKDDEWAKEVMRKSLGIKSGSVLQKYERKQRDEALFTLKAMGLSIRQIERLTGINRGIIQRAKCVK